MAADRAVIKIDDLTDDQGHRWTRREILSLGVDGFEGKYGGNYRRAIDLFRDVAKEGKLEEAKCLSSTNRRLFHTLDKTFSRLEGGWNEVFWELSSVRGGTALLASTMKIDATREDFLRRVIMGWETPCGRSDVLWHRGVHQLKVCLDPKLLTKHGPSEAVRPPDKVTYFKARRDVMAALSTLEWLRPKLPPLVCLCCARRFHHLSAVAQKWIG